MRHLTFERQIVFRTWTPPSTTTGRSEQGSSLRPAIDLLADMRGLRMLSPFLRQTHTLTSAARALGRPASSLAHWVPRFVEAGLLERRGEQQRAGVAMPRYRAPARKLVVPFELIPFDTRVRLLDGGRLMVLRRFMTAWTRRSRRRARSGSASPPTATRGRSSTSRSRPRTGDAILHRRMAHARSVRRRCARTQPRDGSVGRAVRRPGRVEDVSGARRRRSGAVIPVAQRERPLGLSPCSSPTRHPGDRRHSHRQLDSHRPLGLGTDGWDSDVRGRGRRGGRRGVRRGAGAGLRGSAPSRSPAAPRARSRYR